MNEIHLGKPPAYIKLWCDKWYIDNFSYYVKTSDNYSANAYGRDIQLDITTAYGDVHTKYISQTTERNHVFECNATSLTMTNIKKSN